MYNMNHSVQPTGMQSTIMNCTKIGKGIPQVPDTGTQVLDNTGICPVSENTGYVLECVDIPDTG